MIIHAVCETIYEEHEVEEKVADCTTKLVEKCMVDEFGEVKLY